MYTIKTLNAISPAGLAKLPPNLFEVDNDTDAPQGILVRSADMHEKPLPESLLAIARAGAGTNNIPIDKCTAAGIVVFNTPGANANAVAELVVGRAGGRQPERPRRHPVGAGPEGQPHPGQGRGEGQKAVCGS